MVRSILEAAGHKTGIIGTIGVAFGERLIKTENTTPASFEVQKYLRQMADEGCEYCVMEASSIGLKEKRVYGFPFAVGVFTNFSEDHIGGVEHKDMREYLESKALLFSMCETGVVNLDDPSLEEMLRGHTCQVKTFGFSEDAWLRGENCRHLNRPGLLGIAFEVSGAMGFTAEVGIPGKFNAYNALAAMGCCKVLGISEEAMKQGLLSVKVKGRVEVVPTPGRNYTVLIDYAHSPDGLENVLSSVKGFAKGRTVAVFGCGGDRDKAKRPKMGAAAAKNADFLVVTTDNPRTEDPESIIAGILPGLEGSDTPYVVVTDRIEAIHWAMDHAEEGDVIVLCGKGHETYQEINHVKHHMDEREIVADYLRIER
jgi:UDP-N-acetylmuramoyl-L-alanyl-D-glutamate--2,6-diaminopimelate ligase